MVIESDRTLSGVDSRPRRSWLTRARRWVLAGAAGAVVLGLAATVSIVVLVPEYRPTLRPGESYGLDVSHHQGPIVWSEVASDNISAVYMKATEGDDFVDKRFSENWIGADRVGLQRGAYHFFTLCSSGAAQAANFLRTVPADARALPPAIDLEFSNCTARPDNAVVQRELATFVATVERATGQQVVLYALPSFTRRYPVEATLPRDRWVRRLFRRPVDSDWSVWQLSDRARVEGIDGPVDLNIWRSLPATVPGPEPTP